MYFVAGKFGGILSFERFLVWLRVMFELAT